MRRRFRRKSGSKRSLRRTDWGGLWFAGHLPNMYAQPDNLAQQWTAWTTWPSGLASPGDSGIFRSGLQQPVDRTVMDTRVNFACSFGYTDAIPDNIQILLAIGITVHENYAPDDIDNVVSYGGINGTDIIENPWPNPLYDIDEDWLYRDVYVGTAPGGITSFSMPGNYLNTLYGSGRSRARRKLPQGSGTLMIVAPYIADVDPDGGGRGPFELHMSCDVRHLYKSGVYVG